MPALPVSRQNLDQEIKDKLKRQRTMKIHPPCKITARLMAGIDVGDATLSIEYYHNRGPHGRFIYNYAMDFDPPLPGHPYGYENNDLSGIGGLQDGLRDLLAFLGAAAESYRCTLSGHESENSDLFSPEIMEWAYRNADEISMAELDLEEEGLIEEKS